MDKNIYKILRTPLTNVIEWSERNEKAGNVRRLKKRIRQFLINLSGNDLITMLSSILEEQDKKNLFEKYINAL